MVTHMLPWVRFRPNAVAVTKGQNRGKDFTYSWKTDMLGFKNSIPFTDTIAVGDSYVEGFGVATEDTWCSLLKIYNMGAHGFSYADMLELVRFFNLKDVILGYTPGAERRMRRPVKWVKRNVWGLCGDLLPKRPLILKKSEWSPTFDKRDIELSHKTILEIKRLTDKFTMVIFHHRPPISENEQYLISEARRFCGRNGITYYEPKLEAKHYFQYDNHPNELGQKVIAKALLPLKTNEVKKMETKPVF